MRGLYYAARVRRVAPLVLFAACARSPSVNDAGAPDLAPRGPPDLTGVVERFAPTKATLAQAIGVSAILPSTIDAAAQKARAADLDRMASAHLALVRRDFLWNDLEPARGTFDFAGEDAAVADSRARGVATIGLLAYNAAWASPSHDTATAPDPALFGDFVGATVGHYRGNAIAWEIWNEENVGFRFWKPVEDPAAYAELLVAANESARAADPAAVILLGGLNWQGVLLPALEFLDEVYAARPDLGQHYDAIAIHLYPVGYPPMTAPEVAANSRDSSLGKKIALLHAELTWYGDGDKPIYVTEFGWPTTPPVDEPAQARWLVRGAVEAMAAGADRVCFYTLDDSPGPMGLPAQEGAFGIYHLDGTPKLAATALSTLLTIDPDATLTADESPTAGGPLRVYRFQSTSKGSFRMIFATDDQPHALTIPSATGARWIDISGMALSGMPAMVDGNPIYVLE